MPALMVATKRSESVHVDAFFGKMPAWRALIQTALDARFGAGIVAVEDIEGVLRLRASGDGLELRAAATNPVVTQLGFTPLTAAAPIYRQNYAFYRLSEVSRQWNAPSVNFFSIENKDVFGMKVRLQAVNLNDTSENFKREVYQSADPNDPDSPRLRTNPLAFTDEQYRTFGPIVRLFVSGSF